MFSEFIRSADPHLHGRRLLVARGTWLAVVLFTSVLFVAALPARQQELVRIVQQLSPAQELVLRDVGFAPDLHIGLVFSLEIAVPALFLATALLIFWQRSTDPTALLISAAFVSYIAWLSPPLDALSAVYPEWRIPIDLVQALGMVLAVTFLYIFPDGRFVPGWTRHLFVLQLVWGAAWVLLPDSPANLSDPFRLPLTSFMLDMCWWATAIIAQLYRYVRVATPVQRQQTKWILTGAVIGVVGYLAFGYERFARPLFGGALVAGVVYDLVIAPLYVLSMVLIPVAFAVSILRYRLWDIDLILNRAFVYGVLTAILGGLYTTSITLSQRLFVAVTGERSDAAIVLTTLVVASAFTPIRTGLQSIADRHLKHTPDPTRNLRALGDHVRSVLEVFDIEQMARRVLDEAVSAFGATCGAVYLERNGRVQLAHTHGEWSQVEGMSAWLQSGGERYGWITLGPRQNGKSYAQEDQAAFAGVVALVAHTVRLFDSASSGRFLGAVQEPNEPLPITKAMAN